MLNLNSPLPERFSAEQRLAIRATLRSVLRYWRTGVSVAMLVLAATCVAIVLIAEKYSAAMTLLVKRDRVETVVNPDADAQTINQRGDVTEAELNSVAELLKSRDLLEEVAAESGLLEANLARGAAGRAEAGAVHGIVESLRLKGAELFGRKTQAGATQESAAAAPSTPQSNRIELARLVRRLSSNLEIRPIKRTTLIDVSYQSPDPQMAAQVLNTLGRLYQEKHVVVHRTGGAYDFFSEQTVRLRGEMANAQNDLLGFGRKESVVSADVERDDALKQLASLEAQLDEARAAKAAADRRLAELKINLARTAERLTTQVRTLDNPGLIATLRNRVLELELQRTDLLSKFQPNYPPVIKLEGQLAQATSALEIAERAPSTEKTTDTNPVYSWLQNEIVKGTAEQMAALARAVAIQRSVTFYQQKARQLDDKSSVQDELKRALKSAEDNYQLYLKKQEEARISDALDRSRISNVTIAVPATVPVLPSGAGRRAMAMAGTLAAIMLGFAAAYTRHYRNLSLPAPEGAEDTSLSRPVLARASGGR